MSISPAPQPAAPDLGALLDALGHAFAAQWEQLQQSLQQSLQQELQQVAVQLPVLQELHRIQQVHALEHATIWVLSNHPEVLPTPKSSQESSPTGASNASGQPRLQDDRRFHGLSTAQGFFLYGPTSTVRLDWSVKTALRQLQAGETQLALHPRCGTHLAAQALLTTGLAAASLALLPPKPWAQMAGLAGAIATAAELSPDLGNWCQANLTTALPQAQLKIGNMRPLRDPAGTTAHFIPIHWQA